MVCLQYLESTIQHMQEAWEDILLEMDSKLYNFAQRKQVNFLGIIVLIVWLDYSKNRALLITLLFVSLAS